MRTAVIALVVLCAVARANPADDLEQARKSFRAKDWQSALKTTNPLLYPELKLGRPEEVVDAHILLGASNYELGDRARAREEFEAALKIDPDKVITTFVFSEGVVRLFDDTRTELKREAEQAAERERLAKRQADIDAFLRNQHFLEVRPYYVNFVPFGAGQFQNGERVRGIAFAAGEGVLGGASLGVFLYLAGKYGLVSNSIPLAEAQGVRTMQQVEIGTGIAFFGIYAWGVVDALLHYKARVEVHNDKTLLPPELRDFDTTKPARPKKTSFHLAPMLTPSGAGIGLSWEH